MSAYYNEIDPYAAQWLRNLIAAGHIASGDVDERSIIDVKADDLKGYRQAHFFAGIGGWSYALRLAGWPDDQAIWTGSCPCQPLSSAGQRRGHADKRHLWPAFYHLIAECRPATIFGEQVASADGREWLAGVRADLEACGYACGAADLPASCAGAPHCRQRYFFVAVTKSEQVGIPRQPRVQSDESNHARMVNANGSHGFWWDGPVQVGWNAIEGEVERSGRKYRAQWRIKPGLPIVAHGVSDRMAKVSAFGNAIVPQTAAEFIAAYSQIDLG